MVDDCCSDANLRDVGASLIGEQIAERTLYRASQFYSTSLQSSQIHGIAAVLDLRRQSSPCISTTRATHGLCPLWKTRDKESVDAAGNPTITSCPYCESKINDKDDKAAKTKVWCACLSLM
jgi:hypothetical protein